MSPCLNTFILNATFTSHTSSGLYVRRAFEVSNASDNLEDNRYYFDDDWTELEGVNENNAKMTGLAPSTTYYFRAVLVPESDNLSKTIYGEILSFTTGEAPKSQVTVTTLDATSVTSTTARTSGTCEARNCTIVKVGILATVNSTTPTYTNYDGIAEYDYAKSFGTFWYSCSPGTKYYYRAYAMDSEKNIYYGDVKSFTTKTEPGGSLTKNDFIGTYTVNATSAWENTAVTWSDVQIIPDNGDTVVAVGWNGRDELRAVGIFDKGMQVIRFESDWYYEAYNFDVNGTNCVAVFYPTYYDKASNKAHILDTGGKSYKGEIWLSKNGSTYTFGPCDSDSDEGYFANGFSFIYYSLSDWKNVGNSPVYINIVMKRTATTTTRSMRKQIRNIIPKQNKPKDENETSHINMAVAVSGR